ncbi:MAG: S-ribosylhomocysteine lyase [Oscillospiraceae bacterium]|jgi:S-ribosylhomocysteine lyase|nr:S-ribosylhomocysteine lyase [Oscillospiraceae bacterium]
MDRIASFSIDHTILPPGLYLSRRDKTTVTYDLRLVRPNTPPYLSNGALHTIEHLFATFARNSGAGKDIIYFGPMGCRTGFYLVVDGLEPAAVIRLTAETFARIAAFEGEIPGASAAECGNYLEHDLAGAKAEAQKYAEILQDYPAERLAYPG